MQGCDMKVKSKEPSVSGNDYRLADEFLDPAFEQTQLSEQLELASLYPNRNPDYFSITTEDVSDA